MVTNIIFDLDGVLVGTDQLHFEAWWAACDKYDIGSMDEVNAISGLPRVQAAELLCADSDVNVEEFMECKNRFYTEKIETILPSGELVGLLNYLKVKYNVVITSYSQNALMVYTKLDLFTTSIPLQVVEDHTQGKFAYTAMMHGMNRAETLAVDDNDEQIMEAIDDGFMARKIKCKDYLTFKQWYINE